MHASSAVMRVFSAFARLRFYFACLGLFLRISELSLVLLLSCELQMLQTPSFSVNAHEHACIAIGRLIDCLRALFLAHAIEYI